MGCPRHGSIKNYYFITEADVKYYQDLREYIDALRKNDKLITVKRRIDKDTELHPLVRWQYCGLDAFQRKGFLFEDVTDSRGTQYKPSVAISIIGASNEIYAMAMQCEVQEIVEKWSRARKKPIEPEMVSSGPVKENILHGEDLKKPGGGLEAFPIPISTPGFDPAPYLTAPCIITKDPDTGIRNIGTYRMMLKGGTKTGMFFSPTQHIARHWKKWKSLGKPMETAICLGPMPAVAMVSVTNVPYSIDEYSIAGGIADFPVELVKCETIDMEVPATAEIVLEGIVTTDYLEPEGPFGEATGYMGEQTMSPNFEIKCITHRNNPIYHAFFSQFPPSESSKIREIARDANYYQQLKYANNIPSILDVSFHEGSASSPFCVIKMKKDNPWQVWQALNIAVGYDSGVGKIIIAVDEDIDPRNLDAVVWAMSYRMQPHRDVRIVTGKRQMLDPSSAPLDANIPLNLQGTSSILIDATVKWDYPPVALPAKRFMEKARKIWEEERLPSLSPRKPWYGYNLGFWTEENQRQAEMAVRGEYRKVAEEFADKGKGGF